VQEAWKYIDTASSELYARDEPERNNVIAAEAQRAQGWHGGSRSIASADDRERQREARSRGLAHCRSVG
jgi:hypothetical protein